MLEYCNLVIKISKNDLIVMSCSGEEIDKIFFYYDQKTVIQDIKNYSNAGFRAIFGDLPAKISNILEVVTPSKLIIFSTNLIQFSKL